MRRNLLAAIVLIASLTLVVSAVGIEPIFYAPFDGSPDAAISAGNGQGTIIGNLQYEQEGVVLSGSEAIGFETAGNIDPAAGTIMFRVKLSMDTTELTTQQEFFSIYIDNDNRRRLHLDQNDHGIHWFHKVGGVSGIAQKADVEWKTGEWHRIIASWENGKPLILYLDDEMLEGGESNILDPMPEFFHVGSYRGTGSFLQGTIDEFYVFDQYGVIDEPTAPVELTGKLTTSWGKVKDTY